MPVYAALGLLEEVGMQRVGARIRTLGERLDAGLSALGCEVGPTPGAARAGILTCVPPPGSRAGGAAQLAAHLAASGVSLALRRERVRLSPHFYTREDEVDRVVALVRDFLG